jgi:hypothetical protein
MGGFVREVASTRISDRLSPIYHPAEATQGDQNNTGLGKEASISDTKSRVVPLMGMQLAKCWNEFVPPDIDEKGIEDKSKSNAFASVVTILQISQLVISLIARKFYDRPFSQIETLTLTLAICGVGTSYMYMDKPKDVTVPVQVHYSGERAEPDQNALIRRGTYINLSTRIFDGFWSVISNELTRRLSRRECPTPMFRLRFLKQAIASHMFWRL